MQRVNILSIRNEVVGTGIVLSKNPKHLCHGEALGVGFWCVKLQHVVRENAILLRPCKTFKTVGDSKDSEVIWPSKAVQIISDNGIPLSLFCSQ